MKIKKCSGFKNLKSIDITPHGRLNILMGENAQGKTNILEAIYLSLTTRSHKKSKDQEMIRFGDEEAHLRVYIEKNGVEQKIDMHLSRNKRKFIAVNGQPIKKAAELLGIANIIFFSPEDINMIKGGPSERRRFVDMDLSQLDRVYLSCLTDYSKAFLC